MKKTSVEKGMFLEHKKLSHCFSSCCCGYISGNHPRPHNMRKKWWPCDPVAEFRDLANKKKYVDHDLNGSTTWNWASKGWCQKFGQKCSNLDGKLLCWCLSPGRQTNGPWPKNPNDKKNQKIAVSLSFFQGAKMINPHPFPLIFKTTRNHGVELYAFILAPVSWYLIAIGGMVCVFGLSKLVSSFPTQQLLASLGFS